MEDPRSPARGPPPAAPHLPAAAARPPLPPHLQHTVHWALTALQAQRLLYPRQCAAAEAEVASARREAQQHVEAALGPFSYSHAQSELDAARQAAKQLSRRRLQLHSRESGGAAAAGGSPDPLPAVPAAATAAVDEEEDLWAGFEAFSAAVAAEVDRRIATVRLHPPAPAAARGDRLRHLQQRRLPLHASDAPEAAAEPPSTRQPLSSLQQQEARLPTAAAAKPAGAQRKRERSPQAPEALPPAAPSGGRKASRQQAGGKQGAAAQPATASPSSKRPKPHVAFGTRCDARRPVPRSSRPIKLEAAGAPTPPQLPPLQQEVAAKLPAHGHQDAAGLSAAAVAAGPGSTSDLLRTLTAALGGAASGDEPCAAGTAAPPFLKSTADQGAAGSTEMQRMLAGLTSALQGAPPPADAQPQEGQRSSGVLPAALLQHGIEASVLRDAGALLQAVLDRMEGMEQRAAVCAPEPPELAQGIASSAPAAASAAGSSGLAEGPPPAPASGSPSAQQLCDQFSRLLQASGAGLEEVQQQLEVMQRAEAAAQRMEAAATRSALTGMEAAAQAAEQAAALPLAAVKPPPAEMASGPDAAPLAQAAPPAPEHSLSERAAAAPATALVAEQKHRVSQAPLLAVVESAMPPSSPRPGSAAVGTDDKPVPSGRAVDAEAEQPLAEAQQAAALPPAGLPPAPVVLFATDAAPVEAAALPSERPRTGNPAEPAEGWPVEWQPPIVPGFPLPLPPAPAHAQWFVPAEHLGMWQSASALAPSALQVLAPQLGGGMCPGQPAPGGPEQAQQEAAVQWESPFSVACDEELPDSPSAKTCNSPTTAPSSFAGGEPCELQGAQQQAGVHLEEEGRQQAVLDELAALSIRQYQQHAHLDEDFGCGQLAAADGAWHAATAGGGGSPPSPEPVPEGEEQAQAMGSATATEMAPPLAPATAADGRVGVTAPPAPVPTSPAAALPSAAPAKPALPRPPAPYQPLKAAAEAAAAARRAEEAAGWHRLRQRADELALWHEYAAELGISMQAPQQEQLEQDRQGTPLAPLPQPDAAWGVAQPAAGSGAAGSWGTQQRMSFQLSPGQQRLWRPGQIDAGRSETGPSAEPASLASPLLATPLDDGCTDGSGTPDSSSLLASEESSSPLSSASTSSSLGVGARHKARALRYRLLRRRLEQATGLRASLMLHSDAPSESDCASPASTASLATPLPCKLPSGGNEQPRLRRLQDEPAAAVQAAAACLPASSTAAAECKPESGAAAKLATVRGDARLGAAAQGPAEVGLEGSPSTASAEFRDAAASPPFDSHLADHLSSATPSECPTLGSRVPGGAGLAAVEAAGNGGRPWRRVSDSSCSTLREVGL